MLAGIDMAKDFKHKGILLKKLEQKKKLNKKKNRELAKKAAKMGCQLYPEHFKSMKICKQCEQFSFVSHSRGSDDWNYVNMDLYEKPLPSPENQDMTENPPVSAEIEPED